MSLDFTIFLNADITPADVQARLRSATQFEIRPDLDGVKYLSAEGVSISILPNAPWCDSAADAGITANLMIGLDNSDKALKPAWNINSMRVLLAVIHAYPGDVLFMQMENPALMRKNGSIILHAASGLWAEGVEPNLLAMLDLPYEFGTIDMNH